MTIEITKIPNIDKKQEAIIRANSLAEYYENELNRIQILMSHFGEKSVAGGHSTSENIIWCELRRKEIQERIQQLGIIVDPNTKPPINMSYPLTHSETSWHHPESLQMKAALNELSRLSETNFKFESMDNRAKMWDKHIQPIHANFRYSLIIDRGNNQKPVLLKADYCETHADLRTASIKYFGDSMCYTLSAYTGKETIVVDNPDNLAPWWTCYKSSANHSANIDIETYVICREKAIEASSYQYDILAGSECRILCKNI